MKIFLDDIRMPLGKDWRLFKTAMELCTYIEDNGLNDINMISLDHDLGPQEAGTGYDVMLFLMEYVMENKNFIYRFPIIKFHTANPVGRKNMEAVLNQISKILK